jgi:hypothetical protein
VGPDGGRSDEQKIKLIKNGPPKSACQVYLKNNYVVLGEDKLELIIRTAYEDFSDKDVREFRTTEIAK